MSPTFAGSFYKSGFLAGAQVGVSMGNGKFNSTFNFPPAVAVNTSSASGTARKTSALFGLLGGYRHIFNQDYTIGFILEANVFTNNQLVKSLAQFGSEFTFNHRLKKSFSVIPSVVLGKIFCGRWHASVGLGLAISRFRLGIDNTSPDVTPASVSATQTKIGFVPSIGAEYAATQNVSIIGNVSYEFYGKIRKTFSNNVAAFGTGNSYTTSISPRYFALKVGAIYRF
jgi:opacity protein-like surface antigen